jgi:hypothetical protein
VRSFKVKLTVGCIAVATIALYPLGALALKKNQGLIVKPVRQNVIQDLGSTSAGVLTITNDSEDKLVVTLSSENFGVVNEKYDYEFKNDESAKWVRFVDTQVELLPREKKQVSYSLAIPASATPGAYDIALITTIEANLNSGSITEYRRVASLMYLDVNGKVERNGSLLGFDIPWLSANRDVDYQLRIANRGNSHLEFDVRIDTQLLGGSSHNQTSTKTLTLPRTVRSMADTTRLGAVPGVYSVVASYSPPQGPKQTITKKVIYIPWSLTLSILAVVIALALARLSADKLPKLRKNRDNH